jgi:hypothetical protein
MDTPVNEKLSSTLSTKENKKIVEAKYHVSEHFDIPCGLDLEDTSVVKWWNIRWHTLNICYLDDDKELLRIHPSSTNIDDVENWKHASTFKICDKN